MFVFVAIAENIGLLFVSKPSDEYCENRYVCVYVVCFLCAASVDGVVSCRECVCFFVCPYRKPVQLRTLQILQPTQLEENVQIDGIASILAPFCLLLFISLVQRVQ